MTFKEAFSMAQGMHSPDAAHEHIAGTERGPKDTNHIDEKVKFSPGCRDQFPFAKIFRCAGNATHISCIFILRNPLPVRGALRS